MYRVTKPYIQRTISYLTWEPYLSKYLRISYKNDNLASGHSETTLWPYESFVRRWWILTDLSRQSLLTTVLPSIQSHTSMWTQPWWLRESEVHVQGDLQNNCSIHGGHGCRQQENSMWQFQYWKSGTPGGHHFTPLFLHGPGNDYEVSRYCGRIQTKGVKMVDTWYVDSCTGICGWCCNPRGRHASGSTTGSWDRESTRSRRDRKKTPTCSLIRTRQL